MFFSIIVILLILAGLFGAKIVAIEACKVVQLTTLALTALADLNPTF